MSSSVSSVENNSTHQSPSHQTTSRNSNQPSPLSSQSISPPLSGRPRSNSGAALQHEIEVERADMLNDVKHQEEKRFDMVDQLHHHLEETSSDTMAMFTRKTPNVVETPIEIKQKDEEAQLPTNVIKQETFIIKPTSNDALSTSEHLDIPSNSHTHTNLLDTLTNYDPAHHSHQTILPSKPYTSASSNQLEEKDSQIAALSMALIKARTAHREAVYQNQLLSDPEAASSTSSEDESRPLTSPVDRSSALLTVLPTAKDDQSLRSYLQKLPIKHDSLMVQRASSGVVPPTFEQKFVTLTYDALYLSDVADDRGSKVADLSHYWLIERAEDKTTGGTISNYAASHARLANAPAAPLSPMAGHSVFRKEGDAFVIRLVPIVRDATAPHLIVEPKPSQMLQLTGLTEHALDSPDTLAEWVDAINLRISLLNLLKAEDHSQVLAHGGKQILSFLCSVDSSSLVLENRYLAALEVFPYFKEALVHRRNYSITLRNVGLDDKGVRILSEILMMNHSITALDLSWNAITDAGMSYLAPVFDLNKNALNDSVNLSYNMIQTEGVREFAQAIGNHPVRKIILKGNKFGDDAVMQFFTALNPTGEDADKSAVRRFELLDFSDNALTNTSIGPLGSMLAQFSIKSLNLSRNQFTDAGLAALLVRLKQGECLSLSSLNQLDLSYNRLTNGSLTPLLGLLKSTRNIRLDLSGNHLTNQSLKTLLDSDMSLQIDSLAIRSVQTATGRSSEDIHHQSMEKKLEGAAAGMTDKMSAARLTAGSLFDRIMRKGSRAESSPSPVSSDTVERRGSFSGTSTADMDKTTTPSNEKSKTPEPI